jgi:25S rRNA (uracil2634-N3)-methyltransferase
VALKEGLPYSLWNVVGIAHQATGGIVSLKTSAKFEPGHFPGYTHRRTAGFREGLSATGNEEIVGHSRVYVFRKKAGKVMRT